MEAALQPWPALGALLLRDGVLTVEQLQQALAEKERSTKRLGQILVELGFVARTQVARVLADTKSGQEVLLGELHVGSPSVFAAAGFAEISRPTLRRGVMRIDFS